MDDDRRLVSRFFKSWTAIDSVYDEYARGAGITYTLLIILDILYYSAGAVTQTDICRRAYCPKQTVNAVIGNLRGSGYVELKELDGDRRNKGVTLTESGIRYAEKLLSKMWGAEKAAMDMMDGDAAERLIGGMEEYVKNFKKCLGG